MSENKLRQPNSFVHVGKLQVRKCVKRSFFNYVGSTPHQRKFANGRNLKSYRLE